MLQDHLIANWSCFRLRSCSSATSTARAVRVELCWIAEANCVSKKFVEALDLETHPLDISISGVNGTVTSSNHVRIKLQLRLNSYTAAIECIVTNKIPVISSGQDKFNFPRNIRLADPRFHISSDIDLLIGAKLFWNLICVGQVFRQASNSQENTTKLDFSGSFGQHHIDRFKGSLISRICNQCRITRTCQSCLANERHLYAIGQLHNGGKYVRASLFR